MAPVAIRVRSGQGIVVAHVAVRAGIDFARRRHLVRTRQRPARSGVVECYVGPQCWAVARRTIRGRKRRSRTRVHRIVGLLPGRQMASGISAIIRLNRQRRVVPHMALVATRNLSGRCNLVRVRQRETGIGMIERRIRPDNCVVAGRTERRRKSCRDVVRHRPAKRGRAVPRRLMAPVAIRVRSGQGIVVAHVAVRAGIDFARRRHLVRTRQRPARSGVVECYVGPQCWAVAGRTIRGRKGSSRRRVRWIVGLLPGRQMAPRISAVIRLNRQIVIVVDVTVRAGVDLTGGRHLM